MLIKVITKGNAQILTKGILIKFENSICNICRDLVMLCLNLNNITVIIGRVTSYRCIIHDISQSDAIHLSENSLRDN